MTTPLQVRYVDPFDTFNSESVNKTIKLFFEDGKIVTADLSSLIITKTGNQSISVSAGVCLKDFVVLDLQEDTALSDPSDFSLDPTSLYYIVVKYIRPTSEILVEAELLVISSAEYTLHSSWYLIIASFMTDGSAYIVEPFSYYNRSNIGGESISSSAIIDPAEFDPDVWTDAVVYYNSISTKFSLAVAENSIRNNAVGIADITNGRVYLFGKRAFENSTLSSNQQYYLSDVDPGQLVTSPTTGITVKVGVGYDDGSTTGLYVDVDRSFSDGTYASYDNSASGLAATNVQDAIDEIALVGKEIGFYSGAIDNGSPVTINLTQEVDYGKLHINVWTYDGPTLSLDYSDTIVIDQIAQDQVYVDNTGSNKTGKIYISK